MSSANKKLRACLRCSFVASNNDFKRQGCPNCEEVLRMRGSHDRVQECTTSRFDGVIAMLQPSDSWVAKWQRNDQHSPGVYAVRLTGSLPDAIVQDLTDRGFKVQSREMDD